MSMERVLNNPEQDENFEKLNSGTVGKKRKKSCNYEPMENEVCFRTNNKRKCYIQWIATFTMFLLTTVAGIHIGWASPNFARFSRNSSEISVTTNELTWLASSDSLGVFLGAILGPVSIEYFGPKQTGLIAFALYSVAWIFIMIASNYFWLLIARFIGGHTLTTATICAAIYLGEISEPKVRGTLISISTTGGAFGILLGVFLETYLSSKISCLIYLIQCLVGIALLWFVLPESPYFLAKFHDIAKTRKSVALYFPNQEIEEKLNEIRNFVEDQANVCLIEKLKFLKIPAVKMSLMLTVMLSMFVRSSGMMNITRFMEIILLRGKSFIVEPQKLVLYINTTCILFRFATCNVADKFGRKFLLIMGSIFVTLSLICLGIYFYLLNLKISLNGYEWFPIICIFMFMISFSVGFFTGLNTVLSEIFPPNFKNIATCVVYIVGSLFDFVLSSIFLPVSDSFGEQYIFWIHATFAFLVTPLAIFFLPETKGKTLEEIQNSLLKK